MTSYFTAFLWSFLFLPLNPVAIYTNSSFPVIGETENQAFAGEVNPSNSNEEMSSHRGSGR